MFDAASQTVRIEGEMNAIHPGSFKTALPFSFVPLPPFFFLGKYIKAWRLIQLLQVSQVC